MIRRFSGAAMVAGVAGRPIGHSLSPLLHNAWIDAAGLDAVYVPYSPSETGFAAFIDGFRGGVIRGLNVTLPFKAAALACADIPTPFARAAGAANLLLFHRDGRIEARNTDGDGLLYAFAQQSPALDLKSRPVAIIGAGGAARGAAAALIQAEVSDIRILNRTPTRAASIASDLAGVSAWALSDASALDEVGVIINATSAEVGGGELQIDFSRLDGNAVAMDMLYRPLETRFLSHAKAAGLCVVDGLDMLIGQAWPSFEALFGQAPPSSLDARALLLNALQTL